MEACRLDASLLVTRGNMADAHEKLFVAGRR